MTAVLFEGSRTVISSKTKSVPILTVVSSLSWGALLSWVINLLVVMQKVAEKLGETSKVRMTAVANRLQIRFFITPFEPLEIVRLPIKGLSILADASAERATKSRSK